MLEEALDSGVNFFDTADNYSYGDSEILLGQVIAGRRDQVILCTKSGHTRGHIRHVGKFAIPLIKKLVRGLKPLRRVATTATSSLSGGRNFLPSYITQSIEQSLRRFNTDYLDIFLIHGFFHADLEDDALLNSLELLKAKVLIRHYGVSCTRGTGGDDVLKFLDLPGLTVLQVSFSPYNTQAFDAARARAADRGMGLIARDIFYKDKWTLGCWPLIH